MLLTRSRYVEELKTLGMSHRVLGFNDTAIDCAGMGSPKKRARIRGGYCQFTYTVHSGTSKPEDVIRLGSDGNRVKR